MNMPTLQFLLTSLTEMQLLSPAQSIYNHAFKNIRKLAMLLRAAISTKTEEAVKKVYSWSFLWSCRLWANVLAGGIEGSSDSKESQLKPLIYPLVQIILGVMRLKTSSKYFPHRFHCIKLAIQLASKTQQFIPVASYLFEIFESVEITKSGKPSTIKQFDFTSNVRAQKGYIGTRVYQSGVIEEAIDLLYEYYASLATNIAFPELVLPALCQLKKIGKATKNANLGKQISQLLEKLQQNSAYVTQKRSGLEISPKDLELAVCIYLISKEAFLSDIDPAQIPLLKFMSSKKRVKEQVLKLAQN